MKKILFNRTFGELRVAILEGKRCIEYLVERESTRSFLGSIFLGVVKRILPGMNTTFVDIGLDRSAFLFGSDVIDDFESKSSANELTTKKAWQAGHKVLLQISKDAIGNKAYRATMSIASPGRYLVLLPYDKQVNISKKIKDEKEKIRLKSVMEEIVEGDMGVVVRTVSASISKEKLESDYVFLKKQWSFIEKKINNKKAPSEVYKELDLKYKILRDVNYAEIDEIVVDNFDDYEELLDFSAKVLPEITSKISLHKTNKEIFKSYGIASYLSKLENNKVELKTGINLVIEETEALTSIDVNTAKYLGKNNFEETILRANLDAVPAVVDQIRSRNIGGIIIIDFIDMSQPSHRNLVFDNLTNELTKDKAISKMLPISEFGLVQITRQRSMPSVSKQLLRHCVNCHGTGRVQNTATKAYELLRSLITRASAQEFAEISVDVEDSLMVWFALHEPEAIAYIEKKYSKKFILNVVSE